MWVLCLNPLCICGYGFYFGASLSLGIKVSMFVHNFLCALYNTHAPMESPYALGLCDIFYVHCSLVLFAPEAHGICEFCLTNSASQVSRVSLSRIPYGSTCSLWSHGSISHSMLVKSLAWGGHCTAAATLDEGPLPFLEVWGFPSSKLLSIATYYFDTSCQFSFNLGLWIGEILAVTFG